MALVGSPARPPAKPSVSPSVVPWLCRPMTHPGVIGGGGLVALARSSDGVRVRGPLPTAAMNAATELSDVARSTSARRLT